MPASTGQTSYKKNNIYLRTAVDTIRQGFSGESRLRLIINSSSMTPMLRPGDAVVVQPVVWSALYPGDLVVVHCGGELITHRLISMDKDNLITKGDSSAYPDMPIPKDEFMGRVAAIERKGDVWDMQTKRWKLYNRMAGKISQLEAKLLHVAKCLSRGIRLQGKIGERTASAVKFFFSLPFGLAERVLLLIVAKSKYPAHC